MDFSELVIILQHLIISTIGLVGNVLVLIVYKRKLKDNETITFIIIHLAITDFLCCALLIPINCYHELNIGKITSDFMCKFHSFLNIINITYSCLLMSLVAFERFFCIVYPFKKIVSKFRAKIILSILFLFCLATGLAGCLGIGIYHKVYRLKSLNSIDSNNSDGFLLENFHHESSKKSEIGIFVSNKSNSLIQDEHSPNSLHIIDLKNKENLPSLEEDDLWSKKIFVTSENPINQENLTSFWIPIKDCFPNDKIISMKYFALIRLFQNSIVVICFSLIFVVYAFLCVVVSKRRHLKANRENYYKEILNRSKQNTSVKIEISLSRNNSFFTCLSPNNVSSSGPMTEKNVVQPEIEHNGNNCDFEVEMKLLNKENDSKISEKFYENNETEIHEDFNSDDLNNHKSTQTKVSFKKLEKKRKGTVNDERKIDDDIKPLSNKKKSLNNDKNLFSLSYASKISSQNYLIANLKTAFMLFVVTVIMAIVYTPALLTSMGIIEYNPLHWNIIYINNAANPLIYSFLNSNFRKSLKHTLKRLSNRVFRKRKTTS